MAYGCNLGTETMAQLTERVSYEDIQRITDWYLHDEALRAALADIVNALLAQLPHSVEQNPLSIRCCSVVSSLGDVLVPDLGLHDLHRHPQRFIDRTMGRLWGGTLTNFHQVPVAGREHHRHDLVGAELLAQAPPRRVRALVEELFLDGHEQVVGQDAEENVRLRAPLQVVKDRALHQRAFHRPEGSFHSCQEGIGAPDLIRR